EAQPLALSGAQSPALAHSSGALWRIVLSLLTVLSLLLGFVKGVLPRLMARFPAFFERLQKGAALSAVPSAVVETTTVQ
ncbi:hypothetical protein, partial [Salmonella enterica]|uniref:hypothetical protein n=1 Tax=Salmonella enterica TaxID=28901 RepID=UPI003D299AF3